MPLKKKKKRTYNRKTSLVTYSFSLWQRASECFSIGTSPSFVRSLSACICFDFIFSFFFLCIHLTVCDVQNGASNGKSFCSAWNRLHSFSPFARFLCVYVSISLCIFTSQNTHEKKRLSDCYRYYYRLRTHKTVYTNVEDSVTSGSCARSSSSLKTRKPIIIGMGERESTEGW